MAGTNIINLLQSGQTSNVNVVTGTSKSEEKNLNIQETFSSLMNQSIETSSQLDSGNNQIQSLNEKNSSIDDNFEQYQYKDNSIEKADANPLKEKIESSGEELEEFSEEVVKTVSEDLGVDEDQVEEAMETLGLSAIDLINPQNLAELTIELTDATEQADLILNTDFQVLLNDISGAAKDLMQNLDLNPDQFQEFIAEMTMLEKPVSLEEAGLELDGKALEGQMTEAVEDEMTSTVENQTDSMVEAENNVSQLTNQTVNNTKQLKAETQENTDRQDVTVEETSDDSVDQKLDFEEDENQSYQSSEDETTGKEIKTETTVINSDANGQTTSTDYSQTVKEVYTANSNADAIDMIEQIVEHIKTNISSDTTSMEMQLNPENLGKLYLNISSKQGSVSAQFTTTTEMAKEAIEAQIVNLKDNLNQAGVKVDAIEVTVASHEFERNLEQNQSRQEQEGNMQEQMANTRRRNISLGDLDDLTGLMTEEESLVAQMMIDNGNSVDLTA